MPNFAALGADLAKPSGTEIVSVDRHRGPTFSAAVGFEGANAKAFLKGRSEAFGQFFGAGHHDAQAAEVFRRTRPQVELQERRRGQQKSDAITADERDRKSTRLNSSHRCISYAVFC